MKLLFCKKCEDVVRMMKTPKTCLCKSVGGAYTDILNAVYYGKYAIPLGFANYSLLNALNEQPLEGMGERFVAFVIPKICPTFVLISKKEFNSMYNNGEK